MPFPFCIVGNCVNNRAVSTERLYMIKWFESGDSPGRSFVRRKPIARQAVQKGRFCRWENAFLYRRGGKNEKKAEKYIELWLDED